jgi:hypothetical protein
MNNHYRKIRFFKTVVFLNVVSKRIECGCENILEITDSCCDFIEYISKWLKWKEINLYRLFHAIKGISRADLMLIVMGIALVGRKKRKKLFEKT